MKVAVIGASMAGLTCAVRLMSKGHVVSVFEKARGLWRAGVKAPP